MKTNDFAMLIVAILFIALASSGMNMITGSSSVTAEAGSVIAIPWQVEYVDGWAFGSSTSARLLVEEIYFGDGVKDVAHTWTVVDGNTYDGVLNYQVPDTEGEYKIRIDYEVWIASKSRWSSLGDFVITITVTLPEYEEPDIPAEDPPAVEDPPAEGEDLGSGVVPDDTPTDQTVEAVILGDSLTDKISMLWDLIKAFFENLFGGTK